MANKWGELSIAEAPIEIIDGDRGINYPKQDDFSQTGFCLFLNAGNVTNTGFNFSDCSFISEDKDAALRKGKAQRDDVVLTTRGTVGNVALYDASIPHDHIRINSGMVLLRADKSKILPKYLYQFVRSSVFKERVAALTTGSAQPQLPIRDINRIELPLPPIENQRAIALILGTLDDKIELNRKQSATLEAMARALFNAWFVDFEPVRAKLDGRWQRGQSLPGLPAGLYDLFPDRLIDSELGGVPEGWDEGSFGKIVSQRSERVGRREVTVLSAVSSGKLARSDEHFNKRVYSKETDKYLLVEQWDFAYNPSRINIGSIGMLEKDIGGGVSPVYVVVRPRSSYQWFLEFSIRRTHTKTWINTLASGSVRQSLSYTDFASIPCVIPSEAVVQKFNQRWYMLQEGIRSRKVESRYLAQLRDTLLPKLIAGELCVSDAERILGA